MPCNCDHLEASGREMALSQIACLLDELNTGVPPLEQAEGNWRGYHPAIYNKGGMVDAGGMTADLCQRLQEVDVTQYSLEMQIWWRDHQIADRKRLQKEFEKATLTEQRKSALAKLTSHERKLLGLKDP
jgi:hypothetical protein